MTSAQRWREMAISLQQENKALLARLEVAESRKPGRKKIPIVASEAGVCGIDPSRDSASCPDASLYRRREGCQGTACMNVTSNYWANYRSEKKSK